MLLLALLACQPPPSDSAIDDSAIDDSAADELPMGAFPGRYLMAVFGCEAQICMDPSAFNHQVWLASSDDAETWTVPEGFEPWPGSVPDLVRRGDTLYVYAGPGEVTRYHFDTDTWDAPEPFEATGPELRWRDPSPMVGPDGLIHVFYLVSEVEDGDPAECPADSATPCTQYFGSAIEVPDSDGARFEPQPGWRVQVELQPGQRASDPDIFRTAEGWGLLITWLEGSSLFLSEALHGEYAPVPELGALSQLAEPFAGVSAGHYDPETGSYQTFVTWPEPPAQQGQEPDIQVRRAVHDSLTERLAPEDFEVVWAGGDGSGLPEGFWAASPGFAENTRGL